MRFQTSLNFDVEVSRLMPLNTIVIVTSVVLSGEQTCGDDNSRTFPQRRLSGSQTGCAIRRVFKSGIRLTLSLPFKVATFVFEKGSLRWAFAHTARPLALSVISGSFHRWRVKGLASWRGVCLPFLFFPGRTRVVAGQSHPAT